MSKKDCKDLLGMLELPRVRRGRCDEIVIWQSGLVRAVLRPVLRSETST